MIRNEEVLRYVYSVFIFHVCPYLRPEKTVELTGCERLAGPRSLLLEILSRVGIVWFVVHLRTLYESQGQEIVQVLLVNAILKRNRLDVISGEGIDDSFACTRG